VLRAFPTLGRHSDVFYGEESVRRNRTGIRFSADREDIAGERAANGKAMFRFYRKRSRSAAGCTRSGRRISTILHQSNDNPRDSFKRWNGGEEVIMPPVSTTAPSPRLHHSQDLLGIPNAGGKDLQQRSSGYGGQNVGNAGATIGSDQGASPGNPGKPFRGRGEAIRSSNSATRNLFPAR